MNAIIIAITITLTITITFTIAKPVTITLPIPIIDKPQDITSLVALPRLQHHAHVVALDGLDAAHEALLVLLLQLLLFLLELGVVVDVLQEGLRFVKST